MIRMAKKIALVVADGAVMKFRKEQGNDQGIPDKPVDTIIEIFAM